MVEHLVILKFKDDSTADQIDAFIKAAKGLQDKIDGVVDLSVGANFTDRSQGFTHGVCVRFRDQAALENYVPHPDHVHVVENYIKPILADILVIDYEF